MLGRDATDPYGKTYHAGIKRINSQLRQNPKNALDQRACVPAYILEDKND